MNAATILTILGIVNGLLTLAKDAPSVIEEAKSLLAKVAPHLDAAGDDIKQHFRATEARLANPAAPEPAPVGLSAPVPHDPRLAQLVSDRDAAHARATEAQGRTARAEGLAQEHASKLALVTQERDEALQLLKGMQEQGAAMQAQIASLVTAKEKAERAAQDAQQEAQHARQAAQEAHAAAQRQARR